MVRTKLSRLVSAYLPLSSFLSEKAMAWTTKSIVPQVVAELGEHRVDGRRVLDVAGQRQLRADRLGQRLDPPAERLALIGEGEFGALRVQRRAMPQAIE